MKKFQLISLNTLFVAGLGLGLAACGGMEDDLALDESNDEICTECSFIALPPQRADLVPEIASGFPNGYACPVGNGNTVSVRVRNNGTVTAGTFVVRTEVTLYTGSQYYTFNRHFLVNSLAAGAVTTLGVNLGDGVNAAAGSDGRTTPVVSQQFFNGVGTGWSSGTRVTQWRVVVDTSMGETWYGSGASAQLISYPANAVSESNESNNIISGTQTSCTFASAPVFQRGS